MLSTNSLFETKKIIETGKTVEAEMKKDDGDKIDKLSRNRLKMDGTGSRGMGRRMNQTDECRGNK